MSEATRVDSEPDETLAALYRATAQDAPPPALDDAIRAAARRAVASGPRRAGSAFGGWRVPMSIAALIVLSVSLVTLMYEEAPELVMPPRAQAPASRLPPEPERAPAAAPQADTGAAAKAQTRAAEESAATGSEPRQRAAAPPTELSSAAPTPVPDDAARGGPQGAPAVTAAESATRPARREKAPEAFPGTAEPRDRASTAPLASAERKAREETSGQAANRGESARLERAPEPSSPAATAQSPPMSDADSGRTDAAPTDSSARRRPGARSESAPAPALPLGAAQAFLALPPAKWLEQIEALRKAGRDQEARASFVEFRRRYPDHPIPDSLKDWLSP